MGIKRPNDFSPNERRLRYLLYDICTEWGYCLSPADTKRIAESREITAEEFALAVLKAENMEVEPELVNKIVGFFITKIGSERLYSNG